MYRIRVDGLEQEFWRLLEDLVLLYEELLLEVLKCLSVCKRVSEGSIVSVCESSFICEALADVISLSK